MGERLFTAVIPPADIVGDLSRWIEWRRDSESRWMDASEWHVTLAFCADVEAWRYDALVERLVTDIALVQSVLGQGPRGTPRYEVRQRLALATG